MVTIETIDEFRRRTNSSYDDARYFLDRHNGDLLEAIIDFEKTRNNSNENKTYGNSNFNGHRERHHGNFGAAVKRAVQKLLDIRIVVTDKTDRSVNVPILFPIVLCPLWHVMILLAIAMMIMGFRFSVREMPDQNFNLENIIGKLREKTKARNY